MKNTILVLTFLCGFVGQASAFESYAFNQPVSGLPMYGLQTLTIETCSKEEIDLAYKDRETLFDRAMGLVVGESYQKTFYKLNFFVVVGERQKCKVLEFGYGYTGVRY